MTILVGLTGFFMFFIIKANEPAEQTCEQTQLEMFAFRECLERQPLCEISASDESDIEAFVRFYDNKNWVQEHCPDSGDDFLSRISE